MVKYLFAVLFLISVGAANAQTGDSLFVSRKGTSWVIKYTVKPGENAAMLARRFYISQDVLEYNNEADALKKLAPKAVISIPVVKENYFVTKQPIDIANIRELYYNVGPKDDIGIIASYAGITKAEMRNWNNLHGNTLTIGQTLFVGWLKMIGRDTSNPGSELAYPPMRKKIAADSNKVTVLGGLDTVFNRQTNNGMNVLNEKGTAVFFEKPGKNPVYYAFHNATQRGSVIKVYNPGTNKTIYVKVLGPIPNTKLYSNCIIGICNAAKEALGITENKAWCELSYSAN